MRVEHLALNAANPAELTGWLCENLGMRVLRQFGDPPNAFFVADSEGHTVLEIYNNPDGPIPDYASMHPATLHLAFVTDDVAGTLERLLAAGAAPEAGVSTTPGGDELAMVRAPGGLAVQLMKRAAPFI